MATLEELQRVCKHHHGRADDFEGMETPIQNHTLRCWDCLVSLEPIPADVVAHYEEGARLLREYMEAHERIITYATIIPDGPWGKWLARDRVLGL